MLEKKKSVPFDGTVHALVHGKPAALNLTVRPLGKERSKHTLKILAENAKVEPGLLTVSVADGKPVDVAITLTPERKGETICVLVMTDGDMTRKWEFSAYVK